MSTILLFLFIFSAAREGLRDAWERQSDDHVAFDFGRLNVPALLATGVLGVWMWEIPDRTDWWHFPLALLVLSAALFGLCMLGTVLIHPERLGLASGPTRKAASSLQTLPVAASRARGQQALVTMSQADQTLQIIGGPRRRLIAVLMLSVMVLLGIFGALLPVTGSLREHASLAMLLCIGMALVLLWEVLFRPWSVLKQHPNQEDGEVFCLLAIMAFFSSFIQLSPAPASDGMNLPMAVTLALMLLMVLFMVASWVIKARRNWSRMTATLLYLGCLPYCLLVAATGQTPSPRPVPAMTADRSRPSCIAGSSFGGRKWLPGGKDTCHVGDCFDGIFWPAGARGAGRRNISNTGASARCSCRIRASPRAVTGGADSIQSQYSRTGCG